MSSKTAILILIILITGFVSILRSSKNIRLSTAVNTPALTSSRALQNIRQPAPAGSCHEVGPLPDPSCTPGATDPAVTQDNIHQTICLQGYTKTVRPPVEYTDRIKLERMAAYSDAGSRKEYELDHLIPLEVGGDPTSIQNLWPEPAAPAPGFHEKDAVENYLHQKVCSGQISLQEAQHKIATDWLAVFNALPTSYHSATLSSNS